MFFLLVHFMFYDKFDPCNLYAISFNCAKYLCETKSCFQHKRYTVYCMSFDTVTFFLGPVL